MDVGSRQRVVQIAQAGVNVRSPDHANTRALVLALLAAMLSGCAAARRPYEWAIVHELTPAFLDSIAARDPAVAADASGRVAITFVTRDTSGAEDLWIAVSADTGASFAAAQRINDLVGAVASYPEGRPLP